MKPQIDLYSIEGKTEKKIALPEQVFGVKVNEPLLVQAVQVFLANQREAHAHAKTRGEVAGSTVKIYRQKGTGRARHGARRAPIFVGGGKSHGPDGNQNYKKIFPQKMRNSALNSALSFKFKEDLIRVIDGLEGLKSKTKPVYKAISLVNSKKEHKSLLVVSKMDENLFQSTKNIEGLEIVILKNLSTYQVLNGGTVIFTKEAVEVLNEKK
jgi:large subunit ribosomal protein L4